MRIVAATLTCFVLLAGCGQKGPLFLPEQKAHKTPATAPTATAPTATGTTEPAKTDPDTDTAAPASPP